MLDPVSTCSVTPSDLIDLLSLETTATWWHFCFDLLQHLCQCSLVDEVDIDSLLSTILAFSPHLKRIQTQHSLFWDFWADNLYNQLVRWQSSSSSPSSSPCLSSGNHPRRIFQKTIEGFNCKIDGQALGAALLHSLGWLDEQAQALFQSLWQSMLAATGSLEEPFYHFCDSDSVWESKRL